MLVEMFDSVSKFRNFWLIGQQIEGIKTGRNVDCFPVARLNEVAPYQGIVASKCSRFVPDKWPLGLFSWRKVWVSRKIGIVRMLSDNFIVQFNGINNAFFICFRLKGKIDFDQGPAYVREDK